MDLQQLTKKNQEFIHIATNQLIKDGKTDEDIKTLLEEVIPTILENQKKGITARSLYGAPTAWAASFSKEAKDRKSTRLNSSHANISYAVFCLKKKNTNL